MLGHIGLTFFDVYHTLSPNEAHDLLWDYHDTEPRPPSDDPAGLLGLTM